MSELSVHPIVPVANKAIWFLAPFALLLLLGLALLLFVSHSVRHTRFELSVQGLRVRGDLYGRFLPAGEFDLGGARVVDLLREESLRPKLRTNGIGLPGYLSGWFRLRNGEKALLFVTDRTRVVRLPLRGGSCILLSVADPDAFLAEARDRWGGK